MSAAGAPEFAGAPVPGMGASERIRSAVTTCRAVPPAHWLWATAVALMFTVVYSVSDIRPPFFARFDLRWAVSLLITAWMTLLGLAIVESTDRGSTMQPRRYLPLGIAASIAGPLLTAQLFSALDWAATLVGADAVVSAPWYANRGIAAAIFESLVIVNGSLFIYVYLRNAQRMARVLANAETRSAEARRQVVANELAAAQALVDPELLFDTLRCIEQRYETDADAGERLIDALIAYLRAAMPLLDDKRATFGDQLALARAYLQLQQIRLAGRFACELDVDPDLLQTRLPALLLPLVSLAVRNRIEPNLAGCRLRLSARISQGILTLEAVDDLPNNEGDPTTMAGLTDVRSQLAVLYGDRASLTLHCHLVRGAVIRLEVPHG